MHAAFFVPSVPSLLPPGAGMTRRIRESHILCLWVCGHVLVMVLTPAGELVGIDSLCGLTAGANVKVLRKIRRAPLDLRFGT